MSLENELDKPMKSAQGKLSLLPELEPLEAIIAKVEYKIDEFNGKTVYITDKDKNTVLDDAGNPIPRKIFNITFSLKDFTLKNGDPRKQWIKVGASMNEKAKLPKLLSILRLDVSANPTPSEIISTLTGLKVKFQLKNTIKDTDTYQNIIFDTIRPVGIVEPVTTPDIDWEP